MADRSGSCGADASGYKKCDPEYALQNLRNFIFALNLKIPPHKVMCNKNFTWPQRLHLIKLELFEIQKVCASVSHISKLPFVSSHTLFNLHID